MMSWLMEHKEWLEALSYVVVLVGIPTGLFSYLRAVRSERADRERGTYDALDEKYIDFQKLCFENPRLDIFDLADKSPIDDLTEVERKQEIIAFTMLFSIFERAYLMYRDQSVAIRQNQWAGWYEYIVAYSKRLNFREAWELSGETFDTRFQDFMIETLRETASRKKENEEKESEDRVEPASDQRGSGNSAERRLPW